MARLLARCCYFNLLRAIDRALAALSHTLAAYGSCQFSAIWQAFSPQIVASAPTISKMLYLSIIASSNSRSCFSIVGSYLLVVCLGAAPLPPPVVLLRLGVEDQSEGVFPELRLLEPIGLLIGHSELDDCRWVVH